MVHIDPENDLPQDNDQQKTEEKPELHHQEHREKEEEKQELSVHEQNPQNQEQEREESVDNQEQKMENREEPEEQLGQDRPDMSMPLTTMPSSPPLSPMSTPPKKPASPPDSAPSPDHTSYPAHAVSPAPSTLSSYQTTYSYNYNHSEPSPPPHVPKTPPSPPPSTTKSEGEAEIHVAGSGRKTRPNLPVQRRSKMENTKKRVLLVFRIFSFFFCLVSLSVMAADKNQGWALDSFHHYKEFRYCMSVNVIGFVYSGLQAYDLAYSLTTGKQVGRSKFRRLLDFSMDQILAYLLLSASSSSAFRVEDWESNWGKDKFPAMAKASVGLSFSAFLAFALSSLFSGHTLFTPRSA